MGLFAFPAAWVSNRVGTRVAIALCLGFIAVFGIARAVVPGAALLIALTFGVGIGMGLAGALMPVAVKERFPDRAGFATGGYVMGINGGAAIAAVVAVPLAHAAGGWRASLLAFSAVTAALLVVWLVLTRDDPVRPVAAERPPLPLRSAVGWWLVLIFGAMSVTFYGLNAWLPAAYVEQGWSEASAGALVGILNVLTVVPVVLVSWLSDRLGSRRPYLLGASTAFVLALVGFAALPGAAYLWAVVGGLGIGSMFPLVMTLPLDLEERPDRVGALSGMMLGVGYSLSAFAPLVLGGVRDLTGSFDSVLWLIAAFGVVFMAATFTFSATRLRPRAEVPA